MPDTKDQPPNQFSLKRMFVVTALVAGLVWLVKQYQFLPVLLICCIASARAGLGRLGGPIVWGAIGGLVSPCLIFALMLAVTILTRDSVVYEPISDWHLLSFGILSGCVFGLPFGIVIGLGVRGWHHWRQPSFVRPGVRRQRQD